ncbi:MAG: polysaccharide deacetylase family protein [Corallococcus sp.]|nr:polysaccharide deacetylase family protein [Corallococcus sp.]MCM1359672.1 polysaccharide deacetylase family protein [Corallococcus sp.]MCM1395381.1 polysaccharide deacetylase family protein [Corallococcus sp.]
MKKIIAACAICLVAMLTTCGIGWYAVAAERRVPIYCVERDDNYVAISFDAAWGADKTQKIMETCEAYGVKATFFLVGFWMDKFPDMVKEIDARGFEIGTHSATHPKMSTLSAEQCASELKSSCQKIFDLTGKEVKLFRPPFGDYNNTLLSVCDGMGLYPIQWSVDSLDWKGLSAGQIAERVQKAKSGDIILCHNNSDHIVEALPLIFEWAKLKGIKFCPIGELIYKDNYTIKNDGTQVKNNNT